MLIVVIAIMIMIIYTPYEESVDEERGLSFSPEG